MCTGGPIAALAEDSPPPPLAPFGERVIPGLKEARETLPPFFRDADFILHLRTYYFNRTKPDDTVNEALAFGGWIRVKSGWLLDTFAMGATLTERRHCTRPMTGTGRFSFSRDRKATTFRARPGERCTTRSTRCSPGTGSGSTRPTSTPWTAG